MNETKLKILDDIQASVPVFKKINNIQYVIRCPICGDSQKNPKDAHCYIKCGYDPSEPLLYNCFLCNSSGRVTSKFLEKLNVKKDTISLVENQKYNRIPSIKLANLDIITGIPIMDSPQVKYIESRLGKGFTQEDYDRFKIIWNINDLSQYITSSKTKNSLPSNRDSITFLSDDKTMVMVRTFLSSEYDHQWRKIKIIPGDHKSVYTIKSTLNLFTTEPIVVNIAEGIMDILSVYKNFNDGENSVYIASLSSNYISALEYAISKGFIGSNIIFKIYIDDGIDEKLLKKDLKQYKWMCKDIFMYKNIKSKDVGVSLDKIQLIEKRI